MNVKLIDVSVVVDPLETVEELMVTDGGVVSYNQLNCVAAVLLFPASSVNTPALTSIEVAPCPEGVKVAEYEVPLPLKFDIIPPLTDISLDTKFTVLSEVVNVSAMELS